jgi:hypothetical protein
MSVAALFIGQYLYKKWRWRIYLTKNMDMPSGPKFAKIGLLVGKVIIPISKDDLLVA